MTNKDKNRQTVDVYTYTYDAANNQTGKTETISGVSKGTTTYTYDVLNRLSEVTEPAGRVTEYTFDDAGNRETETVTDSVYGTTTKSYSYNEQDRLYNVVVDNNGSTTVNIDFTYDSNGNQLSVSEYVYASMTTSLTCNTYDELNRLVQTVTPDNTTIANEYNGEGLRVSKSVNGQMTRYLYEYDKVVLETDSAGNEQARNIYGLNLLYRKAGSEEYYYMYNGHADEIIGTLLHD